MNRKPCRSLITLQDDNNTMGGFFDIVADPKSYIQTITQKVEASVKEKAHEYMPDELYEKASLAIKDQGVKLTDKAQTLAMNKISDYTSQKDVQDQAISSGVNAMANQISNTVINAKDIYKTGGISGLFKTYPIPFYVSGGLAGLITLRFVLGRRRK